MSTTILDFFDDEEEFEAALDQAEQAAVTEREMQFVESLHDRFEEWGTRMFLTDKQYDWLIKITEG